jgi:hypothetical protein
MKQELIRMRRSEPAHAGGPVKADVHPDEVAGFLGAGWAREPETGGELQLEQMKRPQLTEVAAHYGVEIKSGMSNAAVVAAIKAAAGYQAQTERPE